MNYCYNLSHPPPPKKNPWKAKCKLIDPEFVRKLLYITNYTLSFFCFLLVMHPLHTEHPGEWRCYYRNYNLNIDQSEFRNLNVIVWNPSEVPVIMYIFTVQCYVVLMKHYIHYIVFTYTELHATVIIRLASELSWYFSSTKLLNNLLKPKIHISRCWSQIVLLIH